MRLTCRSQCQWCQYCHRRSHLMSGHAQSYRSCHRRSGVRDRTSQCWMNRMCLRSRCRIRCRQSGDRSRCWKNHRNLVLGLTSRCCRNRMSRMSPGRDRWSQSGDQYCRNRMCQRSRYRIRCRQSDDRSRCYPSRMCLKSLVLALKSRYCRSHSCPSLCCLSRSCLSPGCRCCTHRCCCFPMLKSVSSYDGSSLPARTYALVVVDLLLNLVQESRHDDGCSVVVW